MEDIIQAFREHQFEGALKLIMDLEKKRDKKDKGKKEISYQDTLVDVLKASSFNKLARYGEAEQVGMCVFMQ